MPRKKIVFVIVEGASDETALGAVLSRLFDASSVFVYIVHGDMTSDVSATQGNIISRIGNVVKQYAHSNHYTKNDFQEIIHIVDMDGAFIPDSAVQQGNLFNELCYSLSYIRTNSVDNIVQRNKRKSSNLNKMIVCNAIWSIPYRVFYMSCNLDHVLYDKINSADIEKESNAYRFAIRYRNDIDGFVSFIAGSDFSVLGGYRQTWDFIRLGLHSLERHTNFALCFPDTSLDGQQHHNR